MHIKGQVLTDCSNNPTKAVFFLENTLNTCIKVTMISQDVFQTLGSSLLVFETIQTVKELTLLSLIGSFLLLLFLGNSLVVGQ